MCHGSKDVVIAEDNAVLLSVLAEIFKECGYSVRMASDGVGALAQIRTHAPDILLSDLNMPRMSGLELLSIVRRQYPAIKVIAMSGSYSGEIVPPGVAADAFYQKGSTSVARLLQIVSSLQDGLELPSRRVETPIWVSTGPVESVGASAAILACPECLRPYPHAVGDNEPVHHANCPYSLYRIQFAVVPSHVELDKLPLIHFNS